MLRFLPRQLWSRNAESQFDQPVYDFVKAPDIRDWAQGSCGFDADNLQIARIYRDSKYKIMRFKYITCEGDVDPNIFDRPRTSKFEYDSSARAAGPRAPLLGRIEAAAQDMGQ